MVAAGAVAKKWLRDAHGTRVRGCMEQIGEFVIPFMSWDDVESNPFFAPDARLGRRARGLHGRAAQER